MCHFCEERLLKATRALNLAWDELYKVLAELEIAKKEKMRILKVSLSLTPELEAADNKVASLKKKFLELSMFKDESRFMKSEIIKLKEACSHGLVYHIR